MGNAKQKTDDTNDSFMDELSAGTELLQGQFTIDRFLNSGGFGITYLASDSLDRKVVIKECFPSSFCNRSRSIVQARSRAHQNELKSVVQLFVQEARSLAKLHHPNIVGVHQVFEDNETAYMVLDFVEGRDLLDTLEDENNGLTPVQIKGILKDVLGAVQFIHTQDILHRDISPDNILLDADLRPVLIDFGAAREEATKKSRVLSALRVVKDGYSPQEFYIQGSAQTPSSDLYALGATFYHLIAGEIPPNSQARLAAIATGDGDPYEPLVGRIKDYDSKFLGAIDKALGILPKDRLQSAQEWLDMMDGNRRKSRAVTMQVPMSSAAAATIEEEKRSRLVPLLGSVAVVALLALGGLAASGTFSSEGGAETAVAEAVTPAKMETAKADVTVAPAPLTVAPAPLSKSNTPVVVPKEEAVAKAAPASEVAPVEAPEFAMAAPAPKAVVPVAITPEVKVEKAPEVKAPAAPATVAKAPAPAIDLPLADLAVVGDLQTKAPTAEVAKPASEVVVAEVQTPVAPKTASAAAPTIDVPTEGLTVLGDSTTAQIDVPSSIIPAPKAEATPAPTPQVVAEAPSAPVFEQDQSVVVSTLRFGLPFEGRAGSNVIAEAAIVAPVWVRPGSKILAVNGVEVAQISDIDALVAEIATPQDIATKELEFTVQLSDGSAPQTHVWSVPVKHETALPNGMTFETVKVNGDWKTTVTAVTDGSSELQVGDQVVAFVATSEKLTDYNTLRDILERELSNGANQFNFAVSRGGSMWVVSMTYAEGA